MTNADLVTVVTTLFDPDAGSCLVLRPAALADVGPIAEHYFVYVEDIDTCYRLRTAGWGVAIHTAVRAVHPGGHSLSSTALGGFAPVLKLANELAFYESVHGPGRRAAIALLRVARQLQQRQVRCLETGILLAAGMGLTARRIGTLLLRYQTPAVREVIPAHWLDRRKTR